MSEFPSFSINHWPGCANARLQAVQTADRKLCAAVTAVASFCSTGELYGTLKGADSVKVGRWAAEVCRESTVELGNFDCWTDALNGILFDSSMVPKECLGLTLDTYQWSAINALTCGGGVIGAFMGAGKTVMATATAIGEITEQRERDELARPGRCWIFCPLNAMPTWEDASKRELSRHFHEVKIISIDSAHKYTSVPDGERIARRPG